MIKGAVERDVSMSAISSPMCPPFDSSTKLIENDALEAKHSFTRAYPETIIEHIQEQIKLVQTSFFKVKNVIEKQNLKLLSNRFVRHLQDLIPSKMKTYLVYSSNKGNE